MMLVRLYPELLWDILSWLDAEDVVRCACEWCVHNEVQCPILKYAPNVDM